MATVEGYENTRKSAMIREEQGILEDTLKILDDKKKENERWLEDCIDEAKKAKEAGLPEACETLDEALDSQAKRKQTIKYLDIIRENLYQARIIVDVSDEDETESNEEEIKIGKHPFTVDGNTIVVDWKLPVCRHFLLDNASVSFEDSVYNTSTGKDFHTLYKLKMRRDIEMAYATVKDVIQKFPLNTEEGEKVIFDAFLKELADRRNETEFRNIIFSIQKKQGDIIKQPYDKNIIVQGCAGSGKSMIMLHRIPILLYDNPDIIARNSIYVVSPSENYIRMADKMRKELEIDDLNMGTIKDYYNLCIERYGINIEEYGTIDRTRKLSEDEERFFYSDAFIEEIDNTFQQYVDSLYLDIDKYNADLNAELAVSTENDSYASRIGRASSNLQIILDSNLAVLRKYIDQATEAIRPFYIIQDTFAHMKESIEQKLNDEMSKDDLSDEERERLINELQSIEADKEYFDEVDRIAGKINDFRNSYAYIQNSETKGSVSRMYDFVDGLDVFAGRYTEVVYNFLFFELKYNNYIKVPVYSYVREALTMIPKLLVMRDKYLTKEKVEEIKKLMKSEVFNDRKVPTKVYHDIMSLHCMEISKRGKWRVPEDAAYIYLCILMSYKGVPQGRRETLIAIDEAQNVAPAEVALIKKINPGVIMNLFGDERQHIEDTKGIDSWDDFGETFDYEEYDLEENYRNSEPITEFCNKKFYMDMQAINVAGDDVDDIDDENVFSARATELLQQKREGLSAIIVNDRHAADNFKEQFAAYNAYIDDMVDADDQISADKWNLFAVDDVKGLEFSSVIAILGGMTDNEQYIACTRALDKLVVYEGTI